MKNVNAYPVSIVISVLNYPLSPRHNTAALHLELFLFRALISFTSLSIPPLVVGCFPAVEIRRLAWSRVSQHQTAEYCEANGPLSHINQTHAHTRTEREIKKISVRDWLPCCLVKLNRREVKKKQTYLCVRISYPPLRGLHEWLKLSIKKHIHGVRLEDLTSEHYQKWSIRSFLPACLWVSQFTKTTHQSNLYLPQCALAGDCHTEIKMRFANE